MPFPDCFGTVTFFYFVFIEGPLDFSRSQKLCEYRGLLRVLVALGHYATYWRLFWKKIEKISNFPFNFSFEMFRLSKMILLSPVEEKVVFESYAYPFGYFLAL